ncbi:hypothetical protein LguiB_013798 [Lonicera macranthoides]
MYNDAGDTILALAANGVNLLWKWPKTETNLSAEPAAKVAPQLCLPKSGLPMTNDLSGVDFKKDVACFAFLGNDSYFLSAYGGAVSLFNTKTLTVVLWDSIRWKKKKTRMLQKSVGWLPPSETYLQFYKDETHFLAVHDTHLAIYETTELKHVNQWDVGGFPARISHATFSCM